jgi:hypothetical protein
MTMLWEGSRDETIDSGVSLTRHGRTINQIATPQVLVGDCNRVSSPPPLPPTQSR